MTPPPSLQSLIDAVIEDAGTLDPIGQLAVAAATASDLEQTTDALLGHFVDRCRRDGRSWSEISDALGVTKQAVHKRFAVPIAQRLAEAKGQPTFERFTQRARAVLVAASEAAKASGHRQVGTGHLLLGLYSEPEGIAARALLAMQVTRDRVEAALTDAWAHAVAPMDEPRQAADQAAPTSEQAAPSGDQAPPTSEQAAPSGDQAPQPSDQAPQPSDQAPRSGEAAGRPPFAPQARTTLLNAVAVALEFGHNYIGTEHILLALYRDPDTLAARVLAAAGADRSEAQVRITEMLRGFSKPQ
jgi:ATP-dependent Clp protease ATP-binding subunit ClpA